VGRGVHARAACFNQEYYWNADGETADPGRPRQVLVTTAVRLK